MNLGEESLGRIETTIQRQGLSDETDEAANE